MYAVVLNIHKHASSFMYLVIFSTQSSPLPPCTYAFLKCCNLLLKTCFFFIIIYKSVQGQIFISFETVYWYENKSESNKKECTFMYTNLFVKRKVKKKGINTLLSHSCSLRQVFSFMSKKWTLGNLTAPRSSHGHLLLPVKLRKNKNYFIEIFEQVNLGLKWDVFTLKRV